MGSGVVVELEVEVIKKNKGEGLVFGIVLLMWDVLFDEEGFRVNGE